MKNILLGGCALIVLAIATPGFAADMPLKAPPPLWDWQGIYLGLSGGWIGGGRTTAVTGDTNPGTAAGIPESNPFRTRGGLFGFTDGYNWQFGHVVFGYESDISLVSASGSAFDIAPFNPTFRETFSMQALSTWRGRLGWLATPDWLIYATGGAAAADVNAGANGTATGVAWSQERWVFGWTGGGGVEWRFARDYSLKAEYLHVGFDQRQFGPGLGSAVAGPFIVDNRFKTSDDIVRVGLNMKFDPSFLFR
jgi:outer membrane immunogenic protein